MVKEIKQHFIKQPKTAWRSQRWEAGDGRSSVGGSVLLNINVSSPQPAIWLCKKEKSPSFTCFAPALLIRIWSELWEWGLFVVTRAHTWLHTPTRWSRQSPNVVAEYTRELTKVNKNPKTELFNSNWIIWETIRSAFYASYWNYFFKTSNCPSPPYLFTCIKEVRLPTLYFFVIGLKKKQPPIDQSPQC